MTRGDLVHIPQGALLLRNKSANISEAEFLKIEKPRAFSGKKIQRAQAGIGLL